MSKLKQRERRRARAKSHRPRVAPSRVPTGEGTVGGIPVHAIAEGAGLLAEDFHLTALKAQAAARGGASPAALMEWFLAPLKHVYITMDMIGEGAMARSADPLHPACTSGCYACCRLYVEVGPWEAFGIADYVTQAWKAGLVSHEAVLTRLRDEVAQYVACGKMTPPRVCAFLSRDGLCGIYPARPAACRSYYSRSRQACEQYFQVHDMDTCAAPPVLRTTDHGVMATLAMAEELVTSRPPFTATDTPPFYEMQSAVLRILETPNALVRYLNGEDIFAGCARHTPETELRAARDQLIALRVPERTQHA